MESLTRAEKKAMLAVKDGGDVVGYIIAQRLRSVQRKAPHLIVIVKPAMGQKGGAAVERAYFGAILTAAGRAAVVEHA